MSKKTAFLFVTGGVLSSLGKGIVAAALGMLLEARGLKVALAKMDPYLNVDPGTMSPLQHGEVYVLDDGAETDLDLGHYTRFTRHATFSRRNSFSAGTVYDGVIRRERAGGYLGRTVQVIPHVTDEIKRRIREAAAGADVAIIEVGGTVGDIEGLPFLEAIRQMRFDPDAGEGLAPGDSPGGPGTASGPAARAGAAAGTVLYLHLTLVPWIITAGELKTKPTQHSVMELRKIGIQPDLLLCRSDRPLPAEVRGKIGLFCNLAPDRVFSAIDVPSIYEVPLRLHEEGVDAAVMRLLGLAERPADLDAWRAMTRTIRDAGHGVRLGVVGKYTDWRDSYKSLSEALVHGGVANGCRVEVEYLDADGIESGEGLAALHAVDGILVPGGFGERGIEGKIKAVGHARTRGIPFFGICLGLQLAVIEFARSVAGIPDAHSAEFRPGGGANVIDLLEAQRGVTDLGGTMRLGECACRLAPGSLAARAYGQCSIRERHRHRYEVSNAHRARLEAAGLAVTGVHIDAASGVELVEIVELPDHPWFLGCQFHPEWRSRPLDPHPLFASFIAACAARAGRRMA